MWKNAYYSLYYHIKLLRRKRTLIMKLVSSLPLFLLPAVNLNNENTVNLPQFSRILLSLSSEAAKVWSFWYIFPLFICSETCLYCFYGLYSPYTRVNPPMLNSGKRIWTCTGTVILSLSCPTFLRINLITIDLSGSLGRTLTSWILSISSCIHIWFWKDDWVKLFTWSQLTGIFVEVLFEDKLLFSLF